MTKKDDNNELGVDITEQPTGEYPALSLNGEIDDAIDGTVDVEGKLDTPLNGAAHTRPTQPSADESREAAKAAFWLTHLETEVARLHAKWLTIDTEFKNREARIAELHKEIEARETKIGALKDDLQRERAALKAAEGQLTSKDGEITGLVEDQRARDERIATLATELADAEVAHKDTLLKVERAESEGKRLNELVRQERAANVALASQNEQTLVEQERLRAQLQDLETYINGRHDRWSELNAEIADCKNALIGMDKAVKVRDATIARHDEEKKHLAARILDLERQCSELTGRRKEREAAYDELQQKLATHFAQTEQLKGEYAVRAKETDQANKKLIDSQRHIESLERGIKRRDETLESLAAELEKNKQAVGELTSSRDKLAKRADEMEKGLTERSQQMQALRDDLRMSHEQLHAAQQQSSDRAAELAAAQDLADQKSRHLERLNAELDAAVRDGAALRAELDTLAVHAAELGSLRAAAVAEVEQLKLELAAQQEVIGSLETELRAKQATADLLERNVGRITDLGASLAALDRQMTGADDDDDDDDERQQDQSALFSIDFASTVATDDRAPPKPDSADLLPMDMLLEGSESYADIVDIGEQTDAAAARKLVITIGGEAIQYPIVKSSMTIGRGHENDIRIPSQFVSRLHARLSTNGIATVIEDAGSKNGILVNSERVTRRVLRDGDVVNLGPDFNLRFVDATH
jgi:chromosome segregation ATPase